MFKILDFFENNFYLQILTSRFAWNSNILHSSSIYNNIQLVLLCYDFKSNQKDKYLW